MRAWFQIITGILLEELIRRADLILQGCKYLTNIILQDIFLFAG